MTKFQSIENAIRQIQSAIDELTEAKNTLDNDPDGNFAISPIPDRLHRAKVFINVALADLLDIAKSER